MRYLILFCVITCVSCTTKTRTKSIEATPVVADTTTKSSLATDSLIVDSSIVNFSVYEGDTVEIQGNEMDSFRFVKHPLKNHKHLASFYHYVNRHWKCIGTYTVEAGDQWETADLSFDGKDEIMLSSYPNMNANSWKHVFVYDSINDRIVNAGTLSTNITLHREKKIIQVNYEGSNYMQHYQEEYNWAGNKLHLIKRLEISEEYENHPRQYTYDINKSPTSDEMKTIWSGIRGNKKDDARYDCLAEHFFDN